MNECPKNKIYNPKTKRCVNIDGKIGKLINKDLNKSLNKDLNDKIYNPKTKRYVNKNGKIGQELLKNQKENQFMIVNKSITYNIKENDVILDSRI